MDVLFYYNMDFVQFCRNIKKNWHGAPLYLIFDILLGYHLQDQSLFQKKKLTGVPLDKASLLLLEGQIPWLPHKKFLPHPPKKQKVPLFPPPYLKLLGTNHANDIFYIYKLKTQWFFVTYILQSIKHTNKINSNSHSIIIQSEK